MCADFQAVGVRETGERSLPIRSLSGFKAIMRDGAETRSYAACSAAVSIACLMLGAVADRALDPGLRVRPGEVVKAGEVLLELSTDPSATISYQTAVAALDFAKRVNRRATGPPAKWAVPLLISRRNRPGVGVPIGTPSRHLFCRRFQCLPLHSGWGPA
jgi:hypothetical protein